MDPELVVVDPLVLEPLADSDDSVVPVAIGAAGAVGWGGASGATVPVSGGLSGAGSSASGIPPMTTMATTKPLKTKSAANRPPKIKSRFGPDERGRCGGAAGYAGAT